MAYKNNYDEFKKLIEQHHITTLYHFTDRENLESIMRTEGNKHIKAWREYGFAQLGQT